MESSGNGLWSFLVKDNGAFCCRILGFFSCNGVRFFLEMDRFYPVGSLLLKILSNGFGGFLLIDS